MSTPHEKHHLGKVLTFLSAVKSHPDYEIDDAFLAFLNQCLIKAGLDKPVIGKVPIPLKAKPDAIPMVTMSKTGTLNLATLFTNDPPKVEPLLSPSRPVITLNKPVPSPVTALSKPASSPVSEMKPLSPTITIRAKEVEKATHTESSDPTDQTTVKGNKRGPKGKTMYHMYLAEVMPTVGKDLVSNEPGAPMKEVSRRWNSLSKAQKDVYKQKADEHNRLNSKVTEASPVA